MSKRDFWNGDQVLYVNSRHRALYYADIGKEIAALIASPEALLLDYGCGEALAADFLAGKCARLYLYDPIQKIETSLRARNKANPKIAVLDRASLEALPDASLDLMICNSVLQYLSREECGALVAFAAEKLKLGGRLVVADIIPPHVDALTDSWALVEFAYRGGFLLAALRGLFSTFFSRYRRRRGRMGLTTFAIPDMQRLLSTRGFEARRFDRNIGHNQARMTFIAKRV
ncbi:MAG: methyltransferase domain-containing protein [Methylovirgula sp.]